MSRRKEREERKTGRERKEERGRIKCRRKERGKEGRERGERRGRKQYNEVFPDSRGPNKTNFLVFQLLALSVVDSRYFLTLGHLAERRSEGREMSGLFSKVHVFKNRKSTGRLFNSLSFKFNSFKMPFLHHSSTISGICVSFPPSKFAIPFWYSSNFSANPTLLASTAMKNGDLSEFCMFCGLVNRSEGTKWQEGNVLGQTQRKRTGASPIRPVDDLYQFGKNGETYFTQKKEVGC